jgi:hypothetical protein
MYNWTAAAENTMAWQSSKKLRLELPHKPACPFLSIYKRIESSLKEISHVHRSIIHDS